MRAKRVDATQAEIVAALKAEGCEVISLAGVGNGVPDLLVRRPDRLRWPGEAVDDLIVRGSIALVECKTRTGRLRASQQRLIDQGWPIVVLRSAEEAREWARG